MAVIRPGLFATYVGLEEAATVLRLPVNDRSGPAADPGYVRAMRGVLVPEVPLSEPKN